MIAVKAQTKDLAILQVKILVNYQSFTNSCKLV